MRFYYVLSLTLKESLTVPSAQTFCQDVWDNGLTSKRCLKRTATQQQNSQIDDNLHVEFLNARRPSTFLGSVQSPRITNQSLVNLILQKEWTFPLFLFRSPAGCFGPAQCSLTLCQLTSLDLSADCWSVASVRSACWQDRESCLSLQHTPGFWVRRCIWNPNRRLCWGGFFNVWCRQCNVCVSHHHVAQFSECCSLWRFCETVCNHDSGWTVLDPNFAQNLIAEPPHIRCNILIASLHKIECLIQQRLHL
jgi:hypothetical protein